MCCMISNTIPTLWDSKESVTVNYGLYIVSDILDSFIIACRKQVFSQLYSEIIVESVRDSIPGIAVAHTVAIINSSMAICKVVKLSVNPVHLYS